MSDLGEKLTQHHPHPLTGRIGMRLDALKKTLGSRWGKATFEGDEKDPAAIRFEGMRSERWVRIRSGWYEKEVEP